MTRKQYDDHVPHFRMKTCVKKLLPYVDFAVPSFLEKVKRHSSKRLLFTGHVNVCRTCGHGEMVNPPTEAQLQQYYHDEYWSLRPAAVETSAKSDTGYVADPRAIHQIAFVMEKLSPARSPMCWRSERDRRMLPSCSGIDAEIRRCMSMFANLADNGTHTIAGRA